MLHRSNNSALNQHANTTKAVGTTLLSPIDIASMALFSIIFLVGVVGNVLVICVYGYSNKERFFKFKRLVLILAIVDLIASTTNPLLYIYLIATSYQRWDFGIVGCKIFLSIGPISTNVSLGIILIMTIDRDRSLCRRLRDQFRMKTIYKCVVITVILAILTCLPYSNILHFAKGKCEIDTRKAGVGYYRMVLAIFITGDTLFVLILSIVTMRVFLKLTTHRLSIRVSVKLIVREYRQKETKKILNVIVSIGIAFIILIFPRDIWHMIISVRMLNPSAVALKLDQDAVFSINAMLKFLHTSNSCVNVFLYSILNKRFRKDLIKLLKKSSRFRNWFTYSESSNEISIQQNGWKHRRYDTSRYSWRPNKNQQPTNQDGSDTVDAYIERYLKNQTTS